VLCVKPLRVGIVYDYVEDTIVLNTKRVTVLAVVGLAVEVFLALAYHARKGFNDLKWHFVKSVTFRDVSVNGVRRSQAEVKVPPELAERALKIAFKICVRLEKFGFRLLDAVVKELDPKRTCVGEHDLIGERKGLAGKSSLEIKLRTIKKEDFEDTVRKQVQKLAFHGSSGRFWPTAVAKPNHPWAERVLVLAIFRNPLADDFEIRCEALPAQAKCQPDNWQNLFGWEITPSPKRAASPRTPPPAAPAASNRASTTDSSAERTRKRKFDEIYSSIRTHTLYNTEMGSVSDLLGEMVRRDGSEKAKRAKPTIGERIPGWAKTFSWPARSWAFSPHFRSLTAGGMNGYCASKDALNDIHKHLK
jgi:hypothetical protein